jgi:hypothetical protein
VKSRGTTNSVDAFHFLFRFPGLNFSESAWEELGGGLDVHYRENLL